jgi:hypothetical protein
LTKAAGGVRSAVAMWLQKEEPKRGGHNENQVVHDS